MSLTAHLSTLEQAGLIAAAEDLEYIFRHALIQDAAYDSLLRNDRRRLHRAVARALMDEAGDQHGEHAALLAEHFAAAEDYADARRYFIQAADQALAAFANAEAEQLYRRAAELRPTPQDAAWIAAERGRALARQVRYHEAIDLWEQGLAIYQQLGDTDQQARLASYIGRAHWNSGEGQQGLARASAILAELEDAPPSRGLAVLLHETGRLRYFCGQSAEAEALCARASRMAEQLGMPEVQSEVLSTRGLLPQNAPHALRHLQRAVDLGERSGHMMAILRANNNLGVLLLHTFGDVRSAIPYLRRGLQMAEKRGSIDMQLAFGGNLRFAYLLAGNVRAVAAMISHVAALTAQIRAATGDAPLPIPDSWLNRFRGELDAALADLRADRAEVLKGQDLQANAVSGLILAHALLEHGDYQETAAIMREIVPIADQGIGWGNIWPRCMLVAACAELGLLSEARRVLEDAYDKARENGTFERNDHLLVATAQLAAAEEDYDRAVDHLSAAIIIQGEHGKHWEETHSMMRLAQILRRRAVPGDRRRASELLQQAHALWLAMNIPRYAAQAEALLAAGRVEQR